MTVSPAMCVTGNMASNMSLKEEEKEGKGKEEERGREREITVIITCHVSKQFTHIGKHTTVRSMEEELSSQCSFCHLR